MKIGLEAKKCFDYFFFWKLIYDFPWIQLKKINKRCCHFLLSKFQINSKCIWWWSDDNDLLAILFLHANNFIKHKEWNEENHQRMYWHYCQMIPSYKRKHFIKQRKEIQIKIEEKKRNLYYKLFKLSKKINFLLSIF